MSQRPRRYTQGTQYSFSTHEEGITAPDNLDHINEWRQILSSWASFSEKNPAKARVLVRRGIPEEIRGEAWKIISGGDGLKAKNPGVYEILVTKHSDSENCLKKDITRTYPTNKHFRLRGGQGQKALYNVLKVYSIMDPEVGYCQGMSFLCGVLVYHLNEVDAFWVLSAMLKGMNPPLRNLFLDGLPLLKRYVFYFSALFKQFLPRLYEHFSDMGINPLFYSAEWFTTVFSYSTPMDVTARIWDVIMYEGPDYLLALAIAVLKISQEDLFDLPFDSTISYLKQKPAQLDTSIVEEADRYFNQIVPQIVFLEQEYLVSLQPLQASPVRPVRDKNYRPPALPPRKRDSARNSVDKSDEENSKDEQQKIDELHRKLQRTKEEEEKVRVHETVLPPEQDKKDEEKTEDETDLEEGFRRWLQAKVG